MPLSDESMKWVEIISDVAFTIFNALHYENKLTKNIRPTDI